MIGAAVLIVPAKPVAHTSPVAGTDVTLFSRGSAGRGGFGVATLAHVRPFQW